MKGRLASVLLAAGFPLAGIATGATLESLTNQPPAYVGLNPPFLLTDGSVLFQDDSYTGFWKLTPDASGSYLDGTWTQVASLPSAWNYGPYAAASAGCPLFMIGAVKKVLEVVGRCARPQSEFR